MSLVAKLLPPANVLLDLQVSSKKRLFEQVGLLFENSLGVGRSLIFDALFARERMGSTGLGHGVAIPHGRIKGLKEAMGAFIRIKSPIPFEAPDGHPVNLIFVLLVPEKANDLHLQILGELAQLFSEREMRSALTSAPDAAETGEPMRGRAWASLTMAVLFAGFVGQALFFRREAWVMPLLVGLPGLVLSLAQFVIDVRKAGKAEDEPLFSAPERTIMLWLSGFVLGIVAFGFIVGASLLVAAYLVLVAREHWPVAAAGGTLCLAAMYGLDRLLNIPLFEGLVMQYLF